MAAPPAAIEKPKSWLTIRRRDATYRRLLAVADAASVLISLWLGVVVVGDAVLQPAAYLAVVAFVLLAKVFGLYDRDESRLRKTTVDELPGLFQLATLSALLVFIAQDGLGDSPLGEAEILGFWGPLFALLVVSRSLARALARHLTPTERCLLVADDCAAEEFRRNLELHQINADLVGIVAPIRIGRRADDPDELDGHHALTERLAPFIDELEPQRIILASGSWTPDEVLHMIDDLRGSEIKLSVLPPLSRIASMSSEVDQLPGLALLGMRKFEISRSSRILKRAFDATASALALAALAPFLIAIAVAIRLDSRGPVLFRQPRVGQRGAHFEILKFRSMIEGADDRKPEMVHLNESPDLFKIADDPRVTRVGRFLRRWSLDELPQLFNVLRGDMSLVGPRPLVIDEDEMIRGFYRTRLELRPGITGQWQVLGSWRVPFEDMVTLDYLYVANWSLWADIGLLWRTVPYVLGRRGV